MSHGISVMLAYLIAQLCKKNFTLEEYLEFLKEEKEVSTEVEGKKYTVSYYKVSENTKVNVPQTSSMKFPGTIWMGLL